MKPLRPIHLEIQTHRLNPVGILRSSFRQECGRRRERDAKLTVRNGSGARADLRLTTV